MGKRGPAPQPAALRLLNGAQPSKVPDEPTPKPGKMRPPPGTSPEVAEIFNETVAYLEDMKIAYPCDAPALAIYANAVHQYREATGVIDRTSLLVKDKNGNARRNPALFVQREAAAQIRAMAQEFGLTPSGRARIGHHERDAIHDADNPFAPRRSS